MAEISGNTQQIKMKSINVNKLQSEISKVIKQVKSGQTFEVIRYSKPVAYLVSKEEYERLQHKDCEKCISEIREVARLVKDKVKGDSIADSPRPPAGEAG